MEEGSMVITKVRAKQRDGVYMKIGYISNFCNRMHICFDISL